MFKPAEMKKIRLAIHSRYFSDAVSALQDTGVVQVEALPETTRALLKPGEATEAKRISDYTQRFRGLNSLLYTRPNHMKYGFESIEQLIAEADAIPIDARVSTIRKELDTIMARLKENQSTLTLLGRMQGFTHDVSILNTKNIISFIVYGEHLKEFDAAVTKKLKDIIRIDLGKSIIYSMKKGHEKDFGTAGEKQKVTVEFVPEMHGTVAMAEKELRNSTIMLNDRKIGLEAELSQLSDNYYPLVSAIREQLDIETEKLEITSKLGVTDSVVVLEGWVPENELKKVETLIKKVTNGRYVLEHIETNELPPTLMQNPVTFKLFEHFVKFYSLPQSTEVDPTIIFAMAFPIFFGLMVGDVGYGAIMLGLALFILHRLNHPPKKSHLPKAITGFISGIVSPTGLRILAKSIIPGSVLAIILGVIFNEWFGFQMPYATPFDVKLNLAKLLVIAGWIGVTMVCGGFILGFLNNWANRHRGHAIAKLGWLAAAIGFVILGLNVLHRADMGLDNPFAVASYILLVVGIITVIKFEGAKGIMELPSLISHILSYTRLVGILLASAILAEVIDFVFLGAWHHSLLLGIVGTIILILGQLFNIVIAMFEPGIQGARLIYVEFFSKFFSGNGRPFKPFATQRLHTLTKFKLENE